MRDRFGIFGTITIIRKLSTFGNDVKNTQKAAYLVLPLEIADYFGLADRTVIGIFLKHHTQSQIHFNPADRSVIGT